jgi:hypothetical protein
VLRLNDIWFSRPEIGNCNQHPATEGLKLAAIIYSQGDCGVICGWPKTGRRLRDGGGALLQMVSVSRLAADQIVGRTASIEMVFGRCESRGVIALGIKSFLANTFSEEADAPSS